MTHKNQIEWEQIYYRQSIDNNYKGYMQETWMSKFGDGYLVRHIYYKYNDGDESERIETMVFVKAE